MLVTRIVRNRWAGCSEANTRIPVSPGGTGGTDWDEPETTPVGARAASGYTDRMSGRRTALLACILLLGARAVAAQGVEAVGLRALGMGGAFVAVADDATATYWNPGGLAAGDLASAVVEVGRSRVDLAPLAQQPGVPAGTTAASRLGGTLVALGTWPVGATFYHLSSSSARVLTAGPVPPPTGTAAELRRLSTTHVGVNVLQTIVSGVHVGTTLKYVHGSAGLGGVAPAPGDPLDAASDLATRGSNRFDMDAGILADLRQVRLGLTVRNLLAPDFDTADGVRLELPRQVRAGLAVRPTDTLLVSMDADLTTTPDWTGERRSLAVGAEQRFWQGRAAARAGVRASTVGDARPTVTAGGSISVRSGIFADGYVAVGLADGAPDGAGVGFRVAF